MSNTVKLNIPRTAEARLKAESESIYGLIRRMQARASDGRYYHFEEEDRELAISYLKKHAASYGKVIADLVSLSEQSAKAPPHD